MIDARGPTAASATVSGYVDVRANDRTGVQRHMWSMLNVAIWMQTGAEARDCCRYQDVEKVGAITKSIRLHLDTNLGVDQRLPLGTCLTVGCCSTIDLNSGDMFEAALV